MGNISYAVISLPQSCCFAFSLLAYAIVSYLAGCGMKMSASWGLCCSPVNRTRTHRWGFLITGPFIAVTRGWSVYNLTIFPSLPAIVGHSTDLWRGLITDFFMLSFKWTVNYFVSHYFISGFNATSRLMTWFTAAWYDTLGLMQHIV